MHSVEVKTFPHPESQRVVGTLGCLCNPYASYHRGRNNAWAQAVTIFYSLPNGLFFHEIVWIVKGTAVWNGKTYHAKKETAFI